MLATVAVYVLVIAGMLLLPDLQPRGLDKADLHRLVATLGVWIGFVLAVELSPVSKDAVI
jgi:hypothetical protein